MWWGRTELLATVQSAANSAADRAVRTEIELPLERLKLAGETGNDQARNALAAITSEFASACQEIGKAKQQNELLLQQLRETERGVQEAKGRVDGVAAEIDAEIKATRAKMVEIKDQANKLLTDVRSKEADANVAAAGITSLRDSIKHLDQKVIQEGVEELTAFRARLDAAGRAKDLVELQAQVAGLRKIIDTDAQSATLRSVSIRNEQGKTTVWMGKAKCSENGSRRGTGFAAAERASHIGRGRVLRTAGAAHG